MTRVEVPSGPDTGLTWHFGDPFAEQRQMAAGHGVHLLSNREVIGVLGEATWRWLDDLTTRALTGLEAGQDATSLVLDPQGHIREVLPGFVSEQGLWAGAEPGSADRLLNWLTTMRFWTPVEIARHPGLRMIWLGAAEPLPPSVVARRTSAVAGGTEVIVPLEVAGQYQESVGSWAFEAFRIAAGVPRIGVDTDELTLPNELGMYATTWGKGCYPGQEVVARIQNTGRPPRRLVRLQFDGELPDPGAPVTWAGQRVGVLGSAAQHFEQGPIGLAVIRREVPTDAVLEVDRTAAGQEVLVDPEVGEHFRAAPGLRRNRSGLRPAR